MSEVRKNPALERCDPVSVCSAVMQAAQLGLELGSSLGHAYLVPFGSQCQMITGYKGFIELARRSGDIKSITARVVYENDLFHFICGDEERLLHEPCLKSDHGPVILVYAIAHLTNGGVQREVMAIDEVEKIRRAAKRPNPVWDSHYEEMCRKTVIRRIAKYLPLSPELIDVLTAEDEIIDIPHEPEKLKRVLAEPELLMAKDEAAELTLSIQAFHRARTAFKGDFLAFLETTEEEMTGWTSTQFFNAADRLMSKCE